MLYLPEHFGRSTHPWDMVEDKLSSLGRNNLNNVCKEVLKVMCYSWVMKFIQQAITGLIGESGDPRYLRFNVLT